MSRKTKKKERPKIGFSSEFNDWKAQYINYDEKSLMKICDKVAAFATKEGLTAHAKSATVRKGEKNE